MTTGEKLNSLRGAGTGFSALAVEIWHGTRRSLRQNLGLWLLALMLSAALWTLVTNEENPPKVDIFPSDITIAVTNVPGSLDVTGTLEPVHLRIAAPADLWRSLSAANFKATVDLSTAGSGIQEVRVQAESNDGRVRILEVVPSKIKVQLETLKQQTVPVRVNTQGSVPFGYTFEAPKVAIEQVTAIGPESLLSHIDAAVADVNLDGVTLNIDQSFKLTPRDRRSYEIKGVTLEPGSVVVEVPIKRQLLYESYPVIARLQGTVADGYWVRGVAVEPTTVTLVGTREALQGFSFVQTEELDVSGMVDDIAMNVGLDLPPGVNPVGLREVKLRLTVMPAQGTRSFRVALQTEGLATDLKANILTEVVEITIAGEVPALTGLSPLAITPTLDLSDLTPGLHFVIVTAPKLKSGQVVNLDPEQVVVIISQK